MKILLLSPDSFTIDNTIKRGIQDNGHEVVHFDYRNYVSIWRKRIDSQKYRMPFKFRQYWEDFSSNNINSKVLELFENYNPDLTIIYNNEKLLPSTLNAIAEKCKVIILMGDNPYYTNTNDLYLDLLKYADLIITPDSFWNKQLALLGINNTLIDFPVYNPEYLNFKPTSSIDPGQYTYDLFYIGMSYAHTWGYKRALFLNQFSGMNLTFYGSRHWYKWFDYFPELEQHYAKNNKPIPFEEIQLYSHFSKIYPVDANPGILNGVHLRVFDCIATGILPIVEYRKDLATIFSEVDLPIIHKYTSAKSTAKEYIENDNLREKTLLELQEFMNENYLPKVVINRIVDKVFQND